MTSQNDDLCSSPDPYEGYCGSQSDECARQSYHGPVYPVTLPSGYDITILEPQIEVSTSDEQRQVPTLRHLCDQAPYYDCYIQPESETSSPSTDGTPNMDETIEYKTDMNESSYPEDPKLMEFSDAIIPRGFIRKVYLTLSVQFLITAGIISIFIFYEPAALFAKHNVGFQIIGAFFVILWVIANINNILLLFRN